MKINEIHRQIRTLAKEHQRGSITPVQIDDALNMAQLDLLNDRLKVEGLSLNGRIDESLRFLLTPLAEHSVDEGVIDLPPDFEALNLLFNLNGSVRLVTSEKVSNLRNSALAPPSEESLVATVMNNQVWVWPKSVKSVEMSYLRSPKRPKWAYRVADNQRDYEHLPDASQDLEWGDVDQKVIMMKALALLAIPISDSFTFQAANAK